MCPCGTGRTFGACCGPYVEGQRPAATAQALMRSRYSAYVRRDPGYLLRTWHPSTRPDDLDLGDDILWLGLEILRSEAGGPDDREGVVEFIAHYRSGVQRQSLHEASRFVREGGVWLYVAGDVRHSRQRPGRNDPCPCGSGRKYKRCCLGQG
jgi:SEC-C motif-containing protein